MAKAVLSVRPALFGSSSMSRVGGLFSGGVTAASSLRLTTAVPFSSSSTSVAVAGGRRTSTTKSHSSSSSSSSHHLLLNNNNNNNNNYSISGSNGRRISIIIRSSSSSSHQHHHVNDSGSIDSPLIDSMRSKIKEQLNAESVIVKDAYGDGRHVSIDVVSTVFEGESAVSRQRMVYKAIWEELQNTVHAVDQMTTKTPSEAANATTNNL